MLVRRSGFDRVGLFREDLKLGSDVDWTWRASDAGLRFHPLDDEVLLRRIHRANASRNMAQFADGLLAAAEAGATAVIQPGGSMRDKEVIEAADKAGLAMVFTGMRHFRH